MKLGIIIIFHNNETEIDKAFFIKQIQLSETIELCLVDNESKDGTLNVLNDIKEACATQVSVIEIKKKASEEAAKRAGARYMFNQFNLKHIGFINATNFIVEDSEHLNVIIEKFYKNKEAIIKFNRLTIEQQEVKQTLFKRIFSVVDYLKKINNSPQLNYQ